MSHTLVVLISGEGTNLQALIDAQSSELSAQIIQVISNRQKAGGLKRAEKAGIPTAYHNLVKYKKEQPDEHQARLAYDRDLAEIILKTRPSLVVCAGWMHILAPTFLKPLEAASIPVINLHPALPGQFNGINAIERAYEAFQKGKITKTGVTLHKVIEEVDEGEPLLVEEIELKPGESIDELKKRIHQIEWKAIVKGTQLALDTLDATANR